MNLLKKNQTGTLEPIKGLENGKNTQIIVSSRIEKIRLE